MGMKKQTTIRTAVGLVAGVLLLGGCATNGAKWATPGAGLERQILSHDGHKREFWLHVPPQFDPEQARPLVIALHGGGGLAKKFDRATEGTLTAATDTRGMIVVFPQGMNRKWNCGREEIFRDEKKVDDVGFISRLIDVMHEQYGIDRQRVYVTGISNGGFMSYRLALERSDKIAAVAPVTSQIPKPMADRRPQHPISIMVVNGTDDPIVPYQGGHVRLVKWGRSRGEILSTDDTLEVFRVHNGCSDVPEIESLRDHDPHDNTRVVRESYSGGTDGTEVVLLRIEGGGHTWPAGYQYLKPRTVGYVSRDINASEEIMDFFMSHRIQR